MLVLASASPRRIDLLKAAGISFDVLAVDVDESRQGDESPEQHVRRLAEVKARAASSRRPDAVVLGADTVVVVDGRLLGKPIDGTDAESMLRALSGRAHEVLTGVALLCQSGGAGLKPSHDTLEASRCAASAAPAVTVAVESTRVWFSPLSDGEIAWYVQSGEPMDKAGAYAIQGLASRFVDRIDGSYANVVGLPVALVYRMLQDLPEIRRSPTL